MCLSVSMLVCWCVCQYVSLLVCLLICIVCTVHLSVGAFVSVSHLSPHLFTTCNYCVCCYLKCKYPGYSSLPQKLFIQRKLHIPYSVPCIHTLYSIPFANVWSFVYCIYRLHLCPYSVLKPIVHWHCLCPYSVPDFLSFSQCTRNPSNIACTPIWYQF